MTQKDPSGDAIEALEGDDLRAVIEESDSLAVYFCKFLSTTSLKKKKNKHHQKSFQINVNHVNNYKITFAHVIIHRLKQNYFSFPSLSNKSY